MGFDKETKCKQTKDSGFTKPMAVKENKEPK